MRKGKVIRMKEFVKKRGIQGIVFALLMAVLAFVGVRFTTFASADHFLMDKLFQRPSNSPDMPIHIIEIDEATLAEFGQYTDWSRSVYAELIDTLCTDEYAPAVIGFDILFTGEKDAEGDAAFAAACERAGNVVVASNLEFKKILDETEDGVKFENAANIDRVVYP